MSDHVFKCIIGKFSLKDAFDVIDLLFEKQYMAVSCVEKDSGWLVEILDKKQISESQIMATLSNYRYNVFENEEIKNVNWLEKCFENFKPIVVGEFYVFGPHLRSKQMPMNKVCIEIAAATAFGTGEHPTTNRCLLAGQTFFDDRRHESVLDVGCGSGILSIALAKLGAWDVTAFDVDPEAVRIARENAILNNVAHRVSVCQDKRVVLSAMRSYDFIVANILSEPLIAMAESLEQAMVKSGLLVLSGFVSSDSSIVNKYKSLGLRHKYTYDYRGWSTVVFEKT
jgi:ribosomal protein L11 methyltransferase